MQILSIHHIQVTIPKEAENAAREFYCQVLGLPEIPKPDSLKANGGFWCQVGDRQLHVGLEDGVDRYRTKGHLAYQVDDLDSWREHLIQHEIKILESIPIPGLARFECRDPFGNRIEVLQILSQ